MTVTDEPRTEQDPPRLRTMILPNGRWIFVLDRVGCSIDADVASNFAGFAEKTGAVATAVFAMEVDVTDAVVDEAVQEGR